jgi:hypothetical protein
MFSPFLHYADSCILLLFMKNLPSQQRISFVTLWELLTITLIESHVLVTLEV